MSNFCRCGCRNNTANELCSLCEESSAKPAMTPDKDKVEAALGVLREAVKSIGILLPRSLAELRKASADEALAVLTEALAERERDAGRYRFIRDELSRGDIGYFVGRVHWDDPDGYTVLTGTEADATIDAAMKGQSHD